MARLAGPLPVLLPAPPPPSTSRILDERCRRRTSRWCDESTKRSREATSGRCWSPVDPAIRCYDRPSRPSAEVYVGQTGFLRFGQSDQEVFESVRYDPRRFTDADDQVVVPIRQRGRGKASRVPVDEDVVNVWKVQRGKAVELRIYSTEQEALEAVGLSD
jgi:ketosteroid isomerase-like protein